MQRIYQANDFSFYNKQELIKQTAFHEAGHAASIYLGNKKKQLPPVFFQIQISQSNDNNQPYAKVIDGQLIENFPGIELVRNKHLIKEDPANFELAYKADVINLLAGPLAEAKYVSIRDGEALNFNLLNTQALRRYYGGSSDVEKAYAYIEYFVASKAQSEKQMLELFLEAFQFIENTENWKRILNLAHYLLKSEKEVISCEETVDVLDV